MKYFLFMILFSFSAFAEYVPYPTVRNDGQPAGSSAASYLPKNTRPAYGDNGYRVGSHGYNGQRYVPAGRNPIPSPNLYSNQRRNPYRR